MCEEQEISVLERLEGLPQASWGRNVGKDSPGPVGCACRTVRCAGRDPLPLHWDSSLELWEEASSKAVPFLTGWWRLRCWS